MMRCLKCVMPDTRPDTPFKNGICQACLNAAERPAVDWGARLNELMALLDRFDGRCIVPSSGGKDSHFQVLALRDLGAEVTTVTAATCMPTEIGLANLDNLERYAPGHRIEPDRQVRRKLNRLGCELVWDISWPEHVSIFTAPFTYAAEIAAKHKKALLFFGESPTNHYGGPEGTAEIKTLTRRWRSEFGGFLGLRPADLVGMEGLTEADLRPYHLPGEEALEGVEAHFLGYYVPWDSFHNAKIANQAGMRQILPTPANWLLGENLDNAQTGIHDWQGFTKYGYGRGCAQASMDIRRGHATRERALAWLKEYDGLFPFKYMNISYQEVLDYIGMYEEKFFALAERFINRELFQEFKHPTQLVLKEAKNG